MAASERILLSNTKRQYLTLAEEINAAVQRVFDSGRYIMGPEHQAFEREFADYCGRQHAIACGNGTDALELALRACGIDVGDEVITVANAGGYTTTACQLLGAVPVFVDIDQRLSMEPAAIEQAISEKTRAIVVTHLYGWPANMPEILQVVEGRGLTVIEDCAQAHGASLDGRRVGSFGHLSTFSFYPTKNLGAIGDGGAVVTDEADLAKRLESLRQYGWKEKYQAVYSGGRNSRMDELQAAILRVKLPWLDRWNQRRRKIVQEYWEAAEGTPLQLVHEIHDGYVAHLAIARHPERDRFRERMAVEGIDTAIHYPVPDHHQPAFQKQFCRVTDLSVTETILPEIVTLPCFAEMCEDEISQVCAAIRRAAF